MGVLWIWGWSTLLPRALALQVGEGRGTELRGLHPESHSKAAADTGAALQGPLSPLPPPANLSSLDPAVSRASAFPSNPPPLDNKNGDEVVKW